MYITENSRSIRRIIIGRVSTSIYGSIDEIRRLVHIYPHAVVRHNVVILFGELSPPRSRVRVSKVRVSSSSRPNYADEWFVFVRQSDEHIAA